MTTDLVGSSSADTLTPDQRGQATGVSDTERYSITPRTPEERELVRNLLSGWSVVGGRCAERLFTCD